MSVALDLAHAINETERDLYRLDDRYWADIHERRNKVHAKTAIGMSADDIAEDLGIAARNVVRIRSLPPAPDIPTPPDPANITDERADELEEIAHTAMALAIRLRDENPCLTWQALLKLDHRALLELTFVLLAGFPTDRRVSDLYGWVLDLAAGADR